MGYVLFGIIILQLQYITIFLCVVFLSCTSRACTPLRKGYILLKTGNRHPHIVYVYYHSVLL